MFPAAFTSQFVDPIDHGRSGRTASARRAENQGDIARHAARTRAIASTSRSENHSAPPHHCQRPSARRRCRQLRKLSHPLLPSQRCCPQPRHCRRSNRLHRQGHQGLSFRASRRCQPSQAPLRQCRRRQLRCRCRPHRTQAPSRLPVLRPSQNASYCHLADQRRLKTTPALSPAPPDRTAASCPALQRALVFPPSQSRPCPPGPK